VCVCCEVLSASSTISHDVCEPLLHGVWVKPGESITETKRTA